MDQRPSRICISFPDLYCPFPFSLNPNFEQLEREGIEWAKKYGLLRTGRAIERFAEIRYSMLASMTHPTAGLDELSLISKWHIWLFLFDDQFDEGQHGQNTAAIQSPADHLLSVLADDSNHPDGSLAESLASIWRSLQRRSSPTWRQNFIRHVAEYFDGIRWEIQNRIAKRAPGLNEYIDHRRNTGAIGTVFDMIEISNKLSLPVWVYELPQFLKLQTIAANIVCWHNDLHSLKKEIIHRDVNNLVMAAQNENQCSLQEANVLAVRMCDDEMQLFIEEECRVPSFSPEIDRELRLYINGLRSWIRGNLEWSKLTARYSDVEQTSSGQAPSYLEDLPRS